MKLSYRTAGTGAYTLLGDESARTALFESFQLSIQPQTQVEPLIRSDSPFIENRDNRACQLEIVVSIPYSTLALALAALRTWAGFADGKWDLKVEQDTETQYYPAAVLSSYSPTLTGLTVQHATSWITKLVTATAP